MFLSHIVQPTRIKSHSKTLIDNIISNYISQYTVIEKLTAIISDHLPQFLIAPHFFSNLSNRKTTIFERDWSKFNHEEFILDHVSVDWSHTLKLQNNSTGASFQFFLDSMNNIFVIINHLKRLPNINLNSELGPGLPLHYRNLFLLKINILKIKLKKIHNSKKET